MVSSQFGSILKEFEGFFKCPLEPDANNSCLIKMKLGISLQIEMDRYGFLLIACRIAALPMSRYRDNIIQQALKSNEANNPSSGIFGFSKKSSTLIYFIKLDPAYLTPHQINSLLPPFIAKSKEWTDAIAKGETPAVAGSSKSNAPAGLFGLLSKK